ncbi:hypothetical protein HYX08_00350 [Candidatus Woesearchaeota archaeon]|nr:hypothetical protein [Candidatus Woesearchaeota archaeon]
MAKPITLLYDAPLGVDQAILAVKRSSRGGLVDMVAVKEGIQERVDAYLRLKAYDCGTKEFMGKPYHEPKACVFREGNEVETTREYARVTLDGKIIVHDGYIFPGEKWIADPRLMRVIDNKFPLTDKKDFFTGFVYKTDRNGDGLVHTIGAKGKDYVIVIDSRHIVPAYMLDFRTLAKLEQSFVKRELEDPDIQFVLVGSNNPGIPRKVISPVFGDLNLDVLVAALDQSSDPDVLKQRDVLISHRDGHYESAAKEAGASQIHNHGRILSVPIVPKKVERIYRSIDAKTSAEGSTRFFEKLEREGYLVEPGKHFDIFADPLPQHNGGLVVVAKERKNMVEMDDSELEEYADMRKLGRMLHEIHFPGVASNDVALQLFRNHGPPYASARFMLHQVPRTNVHAFVEMVGIIGLDTDPKDFAETMRLTRRELADRLN